MLGALDLSGACNNENTFIPRSGVSDEAVAKTHPNEETHSKLIQMKRLTHRLVSDEAVAGIKRRYKVIDVRNI